MRALGVRDPVIMMLLHEPADLAAQGLDACMQYPYYDYVSSLINQDYLLAIQRSCGTGLCIEDHFDDVSRVRFHTMWGPQTLQVGL